MSDHLLAFLVLVLFPAIWFSAYLAEKLMRYLDKRGENGEPMEANKRKHNRT